MYPRPINIVCLFTTHLLCLIVISSKSLAQIKHQLDPHKTLTQYNLDHWGTDEGLPSNNVRKLTQTQDGFLWLTSFDGLTRFDGIRFTVYNRKNIPQLQNNVIYKIQEDKQGKMWIATHGSGLFSYKNKEFYFEGLANKWIYALFVENQNRIWLSVAGEGLYWYNPKSKKFILKKQDLFENNSIYKIKKSKNGIIWLATEKQGLIAYKNKSWTQYNLKQGLPQAKILEIFFDSKQNMWVGTTKGLYQRKENKFEKVKSIKERIVHKVLEDHSGSLWLATSQGLYRKSVVSGEYELFPSTPANPLTNISDLILDHEESLWIATYRNGLYRIKDGKFTNYTYTEGLATPSVGAICQYDKNTFLVGSNNGKINIIDSNKVSDFPIKTELPEVRIFNIITDRQKNIWISTFKGLLRITPEGQEKLYTKADGLADNTIRISYEDRKGNIWIGGRWEGLSCLQKNGKIKVYNTNNGLSSNFIMSIGEDRKGNMLIGTNDSGLSIIQKDGKIKTYNIAKGLVSNLVFNAYADTENVLWIVTNGGISRIEKGRIFNYTSKEGMPNDSPFDFVEDDLGNVWLPNSRGLIRVSKSQLNAYAKGKIKRIAWAEFDKHDGMKSEDCTGAAHSIKTLQGTIWIPTNGGVVVINPKNIPKNTILPNVEINSFQVDGRKYLNVHQNNIKLSSEASRFIFDYSALSLLASQKVRFKYKLIGFDEAWVDVGKERQAIYTNLPAGNYTFKVIACNNDGVWNKEGVSLRFTIAPKLWETPWFWFGIVVVIGWIIYGVFRWRVYAIKKRNTELEKTVTARTQEIRTKNIVLENKNKEIGEQKSLLEKRNFNITTSINYAKRIQRAMLPRLDEIRTALPESFVFFQPRDIVSGDFYWFGEKNAKTIIAAVDSTGHGVPGAFMSMIGNDLLNEIIFAAGITEADKILNELHKGINRTLRQKETENKDGMDLGICVIDQAQDAKQEPLPKLDFAGARNSLIYIKDGQLKEIKGDRLSIGGLHRNIEEVTYLKHQIEVERGTSFYMFSDGFADQFGSKERKKFGRKRLRELLLEVHQEEAKAQKEIIAQTLVKWKGNHFQVDDILVIGFKI